MTTTKLDFPILARGAAPNAPSGTLVREAATGPLWRNLNNMRPIEGELRRREAVVAKVGGLPTFLDDRQQFVRLLYDCYPSPGILAERYVMVTSHELYIGSFGAGWTNITPRHSTGTVSINTGTAALTGVGTAWRTRRIYGHATLGNAIELPEGSGDWYSILTVGSDTSITLTSNYTGTTLVGANYSIRRTFSYLDTDRAAVFADTLNGDVYLAGHLSFGEFATASTVSDGAVLKIDGAADPAKSSWTFADVSYLMSGRTEVEVGIDFLGYLLFFVAGLAVLGDGRLVVPVHWIDKSTSEGGANRCLYSSHLNPAVWTTSPGGFSDITEVAGTLTALSKTSSVLSFHFTNGIAAARPTGQDDPPLAFSPTRSKVGAVGPRMIASIPGGRVLPPGDLFIGCDHRLYSMTGDAPSPANLGAESYLTKDPWAGVSDGWSTNVDGPVSTSDLFEGWTRVDGYRHTASFHWGSREVRIDYDTGDVTFHRYPANLAFGIPAPLRGGVLDRGNDAAIVCADRYDGTAVERSLLYDLVDDAWIDVTPGFTGSTNGVYAETDVFGDHLQQLRLVDVAVWALGVDGGAESLYLDINRDGAVETNLVATATPGTTRPETIFRFYPEGAGANFHRLKLHSPDGNTFNLRLTRMVVVVAPVGDVRAA